MTDTPPDVQALHRRLLLARSGEERVRMAVSMCNTSRTIVWSSIPAGASDAQRRVASLRRYYGETLTPEQRVAIAEAAPGAPAAQAGRDDGAHPASA